MRSASKATAKKPKVPRTDEQRVAELIRKRVKTIMTKVRQLAEKAGISAAFVYEDPKRGWDGVVHPRGTSLIRNIAKIVRALLLHPQAPG